MVIRRTGKRQFHAISDGLVGILFACPQYDLLTEFHHASVYDFNRNKNLLVGPSYFVPHYCDSMLSFNKQYMYKLMDADIRTVELFAEDPTQFITWAYQYNFVCACSKLCEFSQMIFHVMDFFAVQMLL